MTREEAIEIVKTQYSHDSIMKTALGILIPELRKSKNERMAEVAIKAVRSPQAKSCIKSWGVNPDDVIAWLEKQKELFESGKGMYYYDGEKTIYCGYPATEENPYDFAMNQQEKQKEQKPEYPLTPDECIKPAEWSEEDEKDITHIVRILDDCYAYGKHDLSKTDHENLVGTLKSLRPSWKPSEQKEQKQNKWSKKDKKILQSLHHVMNCADAQNAVKRDGLSVEDVCDFLFSIEPNWKPSEEQMRCINFFLNFHRPQYNAGTAQWKEFVGLESLRNDLLNLK